MIDTAAENLRISSVNSLRLPTVNKKLPFALLRFSQICEVWSSKANWRLRFSLPSIILADLLGNKSLLQRVQKVIVCDLWLVDFDPFCVFLCFKGRFSIQQKFRFEISEIPRAQWNGTFRLHRPDPSHRALEGSLLVIVILIDGSEKRNCEGGFWTLEFACLWKAQ